jgi:hypothetical protein
MLDRNVSKTGRTPTRRRLTVLAAVATVLTSVLALASGQAAPAARKPAVDSPWKEIRLSEPKEAKLEAQKAIREGNISNPKAFDEYWTYYVSQLTWNGNQDNFPKIRSSIRQVLKSAKGDAHDRLAKEVVLPFCQKVAKGKDFSPIARFNALIMVGELCQVEANFGGSGAESLPEARAVLLEFLDPKLPVNDTNDALRLAAMEGLLRHLERGGIRDEKERKQIESAMQSILKTQQAPAGRDAEVHKWFQTKANSVMAGVNGGSVVRGG